MSATIEVMPLLEDAVDVNGQAIIMPQEDGFIHTRDADIAPWAEPVRIYVHTFFYVLSAMAACHCTFFVLFTSTWFD